MNTANIVFIQKRPKILTDAAIERRCRYRLAKHNLCMHRIIAGPTTVYFVQEIGADPEDGRTFSSLNKLIDFCEQLKEKEVK